MRYPALSYHIVCPQRCGISQGERSFHDLRKKLKKRDKALAHAPMSGNIPKMDARSIEGAIGAFMENVRARSPSEHTPASYATDLRQFAEHLADQGIDDVGKVDGPTLRAYLRALSGWGFAKATLARKLSSLRS